MLHIMSSPDSMVMHARRFQLVQIDKSMMAFAIFIQRTSIPRVGHASRSRLNLHLQKYCLSKELGDLSSDLRSSGNREVDYISIAKGLVDSLYTPDRVGQDFYQRPLLKDLEVRIRNFGQT